LPFHRFSSSEIEQIGLGKRLGHLVAGHGHHVVGRDGALAGDGDVRRARANVDQHQVQVAHGWRHGDAEGRNGLQRKGGHFQAVAGQHRLQGVDDAPGQEGGDDI
jgi:hypothetical protein